jgi:addiction module HigA family antidote
MPAHDPATTSAPGQRSAPVHPGEVLWEEFMKPLGLKAPTAAKAMGVPRTRIERLVAGTTPVTPDTALRLSRAFGGSAQFWMNLQVQHDLALAREAAWAALDAIPRLSPPTI